jgi:hypothetical protein
MVESWLRLLVLGKDRPEIALRGDDGVLVFRIPQSIDWRLKSRLLFVSIAFAFAIAVWLWRFGFENGYLLF